MPGGSKNKRAATTDGEDRLGALPDEILQHVLSFLPSCQTVRTCVLAQRWRDQWKSVPALRLHQDHFATDQHLSEFANQLLLFRGHAPIHGCDIVCTEGDIWRWIRYALSCQARVLRVDLLDVIEPWQLSDRRFISQQLVRLELVAVELRPGSLDFSSCPKLEVVNINDCIVNAKKIVSRSLTHLSITGCTFDIKSRTRISAPGLISLELDDFLGWTPVLERVPSLVTAFVRLGEFCDDHCFLSYYGNCGGFSGRCKCDESVHSDHPVLVAALSQATDLKLVSRPQVFIFRKDLKRRPSFTKLKTLLLNEWCVAANFAALVYFLQHSPILEKLTIELDKTPESVFETDGDCNPGQQPIASKRLQVVQVKYHKDRVLAVHKILKILITGGVPSEKVVIERMISWTSGSFSFQRRAE
ncbi:F-box/LRR-repeat protein At3g26922 [Lolium perenne]|uniref:F-box/LRR-repeat protein At3g26922 n=1 Tax=Lolium perenne TaxID=4522 RepID=UPI0021F5CD8F|nr:F-box/FBD/LRR-repeat protein At5g22700-like [Lolium perenne]